MVRDTKKHLFNGHDVVRTQGGKEGGGEREDWEEDLLAVVGEHGRHELTFDRRPG